MFFWDGEQLVSLNNFLTNKMTHKKYHRRDVAVEQLNVAIDLFLSEKSYIAALTLAGAAEEILGKALEHTGNESAIDEIFSISSYFEEAHLANVNGYTTEKKFISVLNKERNDVKHWGNPSEAILEADFKQSAKEMLVRACRNCDLLDISHTKLMTSFNHWFDEHES